MNVNGLPTETFVILGGVGVIVAAWLILRFGKLIARALLVTGILAAIIVGLLALLTQASANRQTAQAAIEAASAAKTASVGQALTSTFSTLVIGGLITALLAALGGAGYLWMRLQSEARRSGLHRSGYPVLRTYRAECGTLAKGKWRPGPNALWSRDEQPSLPTSAPQSPVVYLAEEPAEANFQGWDFEEWGW